ncbi:MAG: GMC family oxidoreductase N-terminal domain-containing protein [Deltaproteobacteria bacterium]|nr:GMC family oxidoreductase N-terminal domain-containing protein [Deltaproteobacteria bacterium]
MNSNAQYPALDETKRQALKRGDILINLDKHPITQAYLPTVQCLIEASIEDVWWIITDFNSFNEFLPHVVYYRPLCWKDDRLLVDCKVTVAFINYKYRLSYIKDRPCSARIEVISGSIVLTTTFSSDDGNVMVLNACAPAMNTMLRHTINADISLDDVPRAKVWVEFSTLSLLRSLRFYPTLSLDNLLNKTRSGRKLKFKDSTRAVLHALTDSVLADNPSYPEYKHSLVERIEQDVSHNLLAFRAIKLHAGIINCISIIRYGRSFCNVSPQRRRTLLAGLLSSKSFLNKVLGNLLCLPVKYYHAASPEVHESLGIDCYKEKIAPEPQPCWMKQIFPANTFEHDNVMEADVAVVGTGAGGAVVAKDLAEKGFAITIIEAGNFYRRESFKGNPKEMMHILYRGEGLTFSIGNSLIALPMGKAVGGSTLINSGTCFRTPGAILNQWAANGFHYFSPDKMAPYYERVEEIIHVQEAEQKYIGPIIKKGRSAYGYSCGPLKRNAIDCDGQGVCTQGCPKDANQSTNITYIPKALDAAAALFSGFEVKDILTDGNRAVGVAAVGKGKHGDQMYLKCCAKAVILSCGTLITPGVIQRNHLKRGNTWIGSNLSVHPAAYVGAVFPGYDMRNPCSIPQGNMIDKFHDQWIMFEGDTAPIYADCNYNARNR